MSLEMNTQFLDVALVSLFLTFDFFLSCSAVSYVNFESVNDDWEFYWYMLISI